jgi:hypothetical protein
MRAQDEAVLAERRERIEARLDPSWQVEMAEPMLAGTNLRYEMAARVQAIACGGIGLMHELVRTLRAWKSVFPTLRRPVALPPSSCSATVNL